MARPPRIWFRRDRNSFFVTIRGKRHNLGPDKKDAEQRFHLLMAQEEPLLASESRVTAVEILDKFLAWIEGNRKPRTYDWYHDHIQRFVDSLQKQTIAAQDLRPYHVTEWVNPTWSPSYARGAMGAIQRAFKWATAQGYIDASPLANLEKPAATRRDNCPSPADYKLMLENATEPFRSLLVFAYETGARPQEIMQLESRHVQGDLIVFPAEESKGKRRNRVIYLNDRAKQIVEKVDGRVFVNSRGNPWTKFSINCRMKRITEKTGKHFALYDLRHAFATRMLESGLGHITVAKLMGHSDASMIAKVYQHIGESNDFLLDELRRAS